MTFTLPWPPSVNRLWRSPSRGALAGRTLLSREGRAYRGAAVAAIRQQLGSYRVLCGPVAVSVIVKPPDRRRRDLDNLWKAAGDSLVHAGLLEDDSQIDELHLRRSAVVPGGELIVRLESRGHMEKP